MKYVSTFAFTTLFFNVLPAVYAINYECDYWNSEYIYLNCNVQSSGECDYVNSQINFFCTSTSTVTSTVTVTNSILFTVTDTFTLTSTLAAETVTSTIAETVTETVTSTLAAETVTSTIAETVTDTITSTVVADCVTSTSIPEPTPSQTPSPPSPPVTGDFCESSGFFVSFNKYTFEQAASVCSSIGKSLASVTSASFVSVGQTLYKCKGMSIGWISSWEGVPQSCLTFVSGASNGFGSIVVSPSCSENNYVVCN